MVKTRWNQISIPRKTRAIYAWRTPYVWHVHEGATLKNGTIIPARPWTELAISEYDFRKQYAYQFGRSYDFHQAFIAVANEFGGVCQDAIQSPIWQWPRTTARKSGEIVFSPRNIVDQGTLRDSYQIEVQA